MDATELRGWCLQQPGAIEADQLVRDLIEDSYDLVVSALPKRVREQFGWAPESDPAPPR